MMKDNNQTKNCDACGNIVSLLAEKCPRCGAPVHKGHFLIQQVLTIGYSLVALFFLFTFLRMCSVF